MSRVARNVTLITIAMTTRMKAPRSVAHHVHLRKAAVDGMKQSRITLIGPVSMDVQPRVELVEMHLTIQQVW